MSTPMFDLPGHFEIGLDSEGRGPVLENEKNFDHYGCWCGNPACVLYTRSNDLGNI